MSNALLLPADGVCAESVPAALSSFVGRGADLERVETLVGQARLVTLAGAGGAGKTRLARETAASAARGSHFPDGIWWVELAPLPPGADPAPAAAAVLGVRPPLGADLAGAPADLLATAVGARRLLLVLDNCEHVVDGCAALADQLLRRCPGLTVLVTSREALGVEGEVVWPVTGLAHPTAADACGTDAAALAALGAYDAVRLFVDRAGAVQPGFALTPRNAPAVAAVATRLDGLPLALELAAANVATLGVEALAARLDDVFSVLTRGRRTALPRHRTLRAMLDWSYHLLAPAERALLAQLAVFRGPFGLEAVEAVGRLPEGDTADVLTAFGRLVEQSLVEVREEARDDAGETRYRLLETVRQYGLARLAEAPAEARAARARHARWVAARTGALGARTWSAARGRLVRALERDVDEIRAALAWAAGPDGDAMTGVRIAGALAWFWYSGVPWGEARALTAAALAAADRERVPDAARAPEDQAALAELLYPVSGLAFFAGEPTRMLPLSDRAAALWDAVDAARGADPALDRAFGARARRGRATMRGMAGLAHAMRGELDTALGEMGSAVEMMDGEGGDRWWHAVLLQRRALIATWGGRLDQAMADFGASVPRLRAVGETWFLSLALEGMAAVALARGDLAAAAAHARESVAVLADEPDAWFVSRGSTRSPPSPRPTGREPPAVPGRGRARRPACSAPRRRSASAAGRRSSAPTARSTPPPSRPRAPPSATRSPNRGARARRSTLQGRSRLPPRSRWQGRTLQAAPRTPPRRPRPGHPASQRRPSPHPSRRLRRRRPSTARPRCSRSAPCRWHATAFRCAPPTSRRPRRASSCSTSRCTPRGARRSRRRSRSGPTRRRRRCATRSTSRCTSSGASSATRTRSPSTAARTCSPARRTRPVR
jgi:predicted ATPase